MIMNDIDKRYHVSDVMKIGILGYGDVGRKLADGFIELGHQVRIGSRDPRE
jgi:8-hydroxy-5-deazaflavin:NADPH oxidoreductase